MVQQSRQQQEPTEASQAFTPNRRRNPRRLRRGGCQLPRPSEQIEVLSKPVVNFLVDDEPPARFMLRPKPICWKSDSYLRYVKSLPCVCCGQQADDPHHVIGHGQGKMGGKAHDLLTMPVCRKHHDQIHRNVEAWEREHGSQISHVLRTIDRALKEGALV